MDPTVWAHLTYFTLVSVGLVIVVWLTVRQVRPLLEQGSTNEGSWAGALVKLCLLWGVAIIVYVVSFDFQRELVDAARPKTTVNPAVEEYMRDALSHEGANESEFLERRDADKARDQKSFKKELESFQEDMDREAERIRKRNQPSKK